MHPTLVTDWIGWAATALFTASYFFRRPAALRRVQMAAALLWIAYGVFAGATPVIAANVLVLCAATAAGISATRNAERGARH